MNNRKRRRAGGDDSKAKEKSKTSGKNKRSTLIVEEEECTPLECVGTPVVQYILMTVFGEPFDLSRTQLAVDVRVTTVHRRFLDSERLLRDSETNKTQMWKSPMATGKSTALRTLLDRFKRWVFVSPRKTFTRFMCRIFPDLVSYEDIIGEISADKHPRVIIQLQSLPRIKQLAKESTYSHWDVIVLDEMKSILKEVLSPTSDVAHRLSLPPYLRKLVSNIPNVYVCDAGMAPWHVEAMHKYLMTGLTDRSIGCCVNTFRRTDLNIRVFDACLLTGRVHARVYVPKVKHILGEEDGYMLDVEKLFMGTNGSISRQMFVDEVAYVYDKHTTKGTGDICHHLKRVLKNRKDNAMIICNTKSTADMVGRYVEKLVGRRKTLVVTGDTADDVKVAFMNNPQEYLADKRCLVHTTCISVGVDFNFPWATETFLIVDNTSVETTPGLTDLYQAIGRNRRMTQLNIFVAGRRKPPTDYFLRGTGLAVEHMRRVTNDLSVDAENEHNYIDRLLDTNRTLSPQILQPDIDENSLYSLIYHYTNVEKSCNASPRLFFDVLVQLLTTTMSSDERVEYRPSNEAQLWMEELLADPEREMMVCDVYRSEVHRIVNTYTSFDLDVLKDVLRGSSRDERVDTVRSVVSMLKLLSGKFAECFYIYSNISRDVLRKWVICLNKFDGATESRAVNLLQFEREMAECCDVAIMMENVRRKLYKVNCTRERGVRSYDDFVALMDGLQGLMTTRQHVSDVDWVSVDYMTRLLVDEHEIERDQSKRLNTLARHAGLAMWTDVTTDRFKFIMPHRKDMRVDINKMTALFFL